MNKKKFIIYLLTFAFFPLLLLSANVDIQIEGNKRINDETIVVYGDIKSQNNYSKNEINAILKKLYKTNFFEDVQISLDNNILKITVREYSIITQIILEGEPSKKIKEVLLESMLSKEKSGFIESNISKDIEKIKEAYESIGYAFAEIDIKKEVLTEKRLNLIIAIDRGEKLKISKINFIGDKKIKDRRLRDVIVSEPDKFWKLLSKNTVFNKNNIELDSRLMSNFYKSQGYYDVQVISSNAILNDNKSVELTYNVNAGKRYRISKIETNVDPSLDKKQFSLLKKYYEDVIGEYYSPFRVKKILADLDRIILDNDLQFIEHSVKEVVDKDSIQVVINIFEGDKLIVERVNIRGNNITNESVIRGELLLDEGDPYNKLKLSQSMSNLKGRGIFAEVTRTVKNGEIKNSKIIDIVVDEKATGEISAGAGIGTNGGSFAFNISENNWLGKGIQLASYLQVSKTNIQGSLGVVDPNYKLTGNELNYNISSTKNDKPNSGYQNSLTSIGIGTKYEQFKDIYFTPGITLAADKLTVLDSASKQLKKQAGTFTDLSFRYGFQFDNRNRSFMPTNGTLSSFSQSLPIYSDASAIRNSYRLSSYNEFSENLIGAFKFQVTAINGLDGDVRLSKRVSASSRRLRGFEAGKVGPKDGKDFIGGNYSSVMNFEAALPNILPEATKTDVGVFLDIGNVWGIDYDSQLDDSNTIRSSAGVNASWISPLGPMSITLAQPISKASTDITQGFDFQLGTTF